MESEECATQPVFAQRVTFVMLCNELNINNGKQISTRIN